MAARQAASKDQKMKGNRGVAGLVAVLLLGAAGFGAYTYLGGGKPSAASLDGEFAYALDGPPAFSVYEQGGGRYVRFTAPGSETPLPLAPFTTEDQGTWGNSVDPSLVGLKTYDGSFTVFFVPSNNAWGVDLPEGYGASGGTCAPPGPNNNGIAPVFKR
jgi:hypothetical protein